MGLEHVRALKAQAGMPKIKKVYSIPKKSKKKLEQEAIQRTTPAADPMEAFFLEARKQMTGTCQCGCGNKSQKDKDEYFRHSIAHIFPKSKFKSIATHPLNWVERAFWGGCHGTMDNADMDKWTGMADWNDIIVRVLILYRLLTPAEQANKFTQKLLSLIAKTTPV